MSTGHASQDDWLHALRGEPSPAFRDHLRARLRTHETASTTRREWPRRALFAAAALITAAILISVPAVRASVAHFVSLFRVVHFVAVPVDSSRLDRLKAENLEIAALIGEQVEVVQDPGPPVNLASVEDAATAAGMPLLLPLWLPENTHVIETAVVGERVLRVTANGQRLQQAMDALGIHDLAVPPGLDGHVVNLRVPPVAMIRYDHGNNRRTRLFQARTPQLTLPASIDVQALGEIGLRILGLPPAEATQFAQAIDWHSTLIVPVPPNASSFRQVNIGGRLGVLIQHQPPNQSPTSMIVWSTTDRVFALVSIQHLDQVLAMAESIR
jgi:hypothetical protein